MEAGWKLGQCSGLPHCGDSTSANVSWLCPVLMGLQTAAEYGLPVGIDGIAGNMLATSHGYLFPQLYSSSPVTGVPRPGSQERSWLQLQKLSPYHQVPPSQGFHSSTSGLQAPPSLAGKILIGQ